MIFVIFIIFLTHIYQSSYHSKRILAAHMPAISIGTSLEPDWNLIGTSPILCTIYTTGNLRYLKRKLVKTTHPTLSIHFFLLPLQPKTKNMTISI